MCVCPGGDARKVDGVGIGGRGHRRVGMEGYWNGNYVEAYGEG